MSSQINSQHLHNISSLIRNRNLSPYTSSRWYGFQANLIITLLALTCSELLSLISTPSTPDSSHSSLIQELRNYLSVLESLIGNQAYIDWKNQLGNQAYGKNWATQAIDGQGANCLVENFE